MFKDKENKSRALYFSYFLQRTGEWIIYLYFIRKQGNRFDSGISDKQFKEIVVIHQMHDDE